MGYKSVDEIDKFRYDDCVMAGINVSSSAIVLELEALIVRSDNSQNTNYTESYAGTTRAGFESGKIERIIKDGYKYFDADEVLQSEVPDRELDAEEAKKLLSECEGPYLYNIELLDGADGLHQAALCIEFEDEGVMGESYQIIISYEKAVFEWERYMNRVQS